MALNTEQNVVRYDIVDGVTTYTIPFVYWEKSDIKVEITDSDSNVKILTLDTDYSLSSPSTTGGLLTQITDWSDYSTLVIYRELPYTQETDYTNGQTLDAEKIETSFDKATALATQLEEKMTRSIVSPIAEEGSNLELPLKEARKNMLIGFDSTGEKIVTIDGADIPDIAAEVEENRDITIEARDDAIQASLEAKRAYKEDIGDGQNSTFTITHNLGTYDYLVNVWQNSGDRESVTFVASKPDKNNLTLTFDSVPSVDEYTVVITCVNASMYGVTDWVDITNVPDLYTQDEIDASQNAQDTRIDSNENRIEELEKPTFTEASTLENITSGEELSSRWGKVKKLFSIVIARLGQAVNTDSDVSFKSIAINGTKFEFIPTASIKSSFLTPGDDSPSGLTFDGTNLISCDYGTGKIYIHDGISYTILSSFNSHSATPTGLTFDGTNLISCDANTNKIYIHNGISSTILSSFDSPASAPFGLTFDGTNLISCDADTNKIYIHNGISSTILSSFSSPDNLPSGLGFSGTNLISCNIGTNKIYIHNGISSTILSSFDSPASAPRGLTFDGTNLISCDTDTNKIYIHVSTVLV